MLYLNGVAITSINGVGLTRATLVDATRSTVVWNAPAPTSFINYTWNTTVNAGVVELVNDGTSGVNATMHSGQGVLFNGVDQSLDLTNTTISFPNNSFSIIFYLGSIDTAQNQVFVHFQALNVYVGIINDKYRFQMKSGEILDINIPANSEDVIYCNADNGIASIYINTVLQGTFSYTTDLTGTTTLEIGAYNSAYYCDCVLKDIYIFNDTLTQTEIDKYSTDPNGFFEDVRNGVIDNCTLNMPLDGTDATVHDYQNNADYTVGNYTTGARDTTNELTYGSQELNFLKNGTLRGALSNYLECNSGYADTGYTPSGTFQVEEVTGLNGAYTHKVYNSDGTKYTNGVSDGTYTIPTTNVLLNDTDIDTTTIDEIRLFEIYDSRQDETTLYNNAVNAGLLT